MNSQQNNLVIFGASNIVSDLFDAALACGLIPTKVVLNQPEVCGERDIPLALRVQALACLCPPPRIQPLAEFEPADDELYVLGPTTPAREALAVLLEMRFGLRFHTLVHPSAYISPLAKLSTGVFVGANSVIAPGVHLEPHVFINRGVTVGHDNQVGAFTRIQPGANLGGLSYIGRGVTIGLGATLIERLRIGDGAVIGGGAVVLKDVPERVLAVGVPAKVRKHLDSNE
ncbi:MAG: hypothetical protein QX199_18780 [Methylococcaceae bacterium]